MGAIENTKAEGKIEEGRKTGMQKSSNEYFLQ